MIGDCFIEAHAIKVCQQCGGVFEVERQRLSAVELWLNKAEDTVAIDAACSRGRPTIWFADRHLNQVA
jgi:hypothetical protein